jgi:hypothetical protein
VVSKLEPVAQSNDTRVHSFVQLDTQRGLGFKAVLGLSFRPGASDCVPKLMTYIHREGNSSQWLNREPLSKDETRAVYELKRLSRDTVSTRHSLVLRFDNLKFSIICSVELSDLLVADDLSPVYIVSQAYFTESYQ